jgi:hypothetical protein
MRSTAKAAAWTARDYLPRPVIEGIKGVLPGRTAGSRALLDGAGRAGHSRGSSVGAKSPERLDAPTLQATHPSSARVVASPASRALATPPATRRSSRHEHAGGGAPRKIKCMTFPRSGHRLLVSMLRQYFFNGEPVARENGLYVSDVFTYCPNYGHCRAHPCSDARTNFQKDHDFELDTPISATMAHVVQYRHPVNSLISWYVFALARKNIPRDSRRSWERFARMQITFWKGFVDKWVLGPVPNRVAIRYEAFVERPEEQLRAVLGAFGAPVDEGRARAAVRAMDVGFKNQARDFRYFDPGYSALICRLASPQLQALGYDEDNYR